MEDIGGDDDGVRPMRAELLLKHARATTNEGTAVAFRGAERSPDARSVERRFDVGARAFLPTTAACLSSRSPVANESASSAYVVARSVTVDPDIIADTRAVVVFEKRQTIAKLEFNMYLAMIILNNNYPS